MMRTGLSFQRKFIVKGQWGFAASPTVSAEEIARITREAVAVARANAVLQTSTVRLAPHKGVCRPLDLTI